MVSSATERKSGVCKATPAKRRAASSTSAAVGSATGASMAATVAPLLCCKQGLAGPVLVEPARGMRQHGVDPVGIRRQIVARHGRATIAARDIVEQPLKFVDVMLHGLAEFGIG